MFIRQHAGTIAVNLKTLLSLIIVAVAVLVGSPVLHAEEPAAGKMVQVKPKGDTMYPYWLYLPKEYDAGKKVKFPVVLFLHGMDLRGNDLTRIRLRGPAKYIREGKHYPFIVIAPQCPNDGELRDKDANPKPKEFWWMPDTIDKVKNIIDHEKKRLGRVDDDRVYVTGISMGGFGCYNIVNRHPNTFAAAAPICGHGNSWPDKSKVTHIPFWAFHGAKDRIVKLSDHQTTVDALKAAGASIEFTIYPDAGHNSWSETYANPKLYEWLLAQKRKPQRQAGLAPSELTCEYAANPLGVDTPRPRFGWLLKSGQRAQLQSAYRVLVATSERQLQGNVGDKWDSGKIESGRSVNVEYRGKALSSGEKCYWKVRVWDKQGRPSTWSRPASFETGLMKQSDWKGQWIGVTPPSPPAEHLDTAKPGRVNLALVAKASTSFVSRHEMLDAINDGFKPANSNDKRYGAYGNWPRKGAQWVQYEWPKPVHVDSIDVYWFDDNGGVRLPQSSRLLYFYCPNSSFGT